MSEKDLRINKFIAKSKKQSGRFPTEGREEVVSYEVTEAPSPKVAGDNADSSLLTESLAKNIYPSAPLREGFGNNYVVKFEFSRKKYLLCRPNAFP